MDIKLIIVGAKAGTKEISVKRPRILGRARGIGIVIPHPTVNERHCLLFENDGLLMIQDLNSEQGTLVGGRKIIMAPLPPDTEFSVGPLTFRAEYHYAGNLESLPKILYDEPAAELTQAAPVGTGIASGTQAPIPAPPATSSFFGLGVDGNLPTLAQPSATIAVKPQASAPVVDKKPEPMRMPPPLPKISEAVTPSRENETNYGNFSGFSSTAPDSADPLSENDSGIPGLNIDAALPASLPPASDEHGKKKSAGLLDYLSKRPSRPNRAARFAPESIGPFVETDSPQDASMNGKQNLRPQEPNAVVPPVQNLPAPPVEVDDDLSSFFKKLE
jgi:hypothetical protein